MADFIRKKDFYFLTLYSFITLLLLIIVLSGLRQISNSIDLRTEKLVKLFESQSGESLARGDSLQVARNLNSFVLATKLKCAVARKNDVEFFRWESETPCVKEFPSQQLDIDWRNRGGIQISVVYTPVPSDLVGEFGTLTFQIFCLIVIILLLRHIAETNVNLQRQALELESRFEKESLLNQIQKESAIARTTQMLAHDVRKPFALFRMTLQKVKSVSSPQQMQQVLKEALPEVERSMASVNGLIADVLNVGGEFQLVLKPVRLASVVEDISEELRRLHPTRNLRLRIDVASDLWVEADDTRLPRVFLNILSNAIEAVEGPEVQLWVSAQQMNTNDERIEIRVGNRGSYIPSDVREKLFDLFFTSGKKGGTGLGLAIVKKIIEGHGGVVKCHSARTHDEPQGMVEFSWTLKKSIQPKEAVHAVESSVQSEAPTLNDLSEPTQTLIANTDEQPKVVFLDDSPLARWVWEAKLKSTVSLQCFAGPRDFWEAVARNSLALEDLHTIITDHYFAADEKITGLEFAFELRARQFKGRILLASNGEFKPEELAGIVDKIVDKQPVEWERL